MGLRGALWSVAGVLAAVVGGLVAYEQFRETPEERVNEYIREVNTIQGQLGTEVNRTRSAYTQFRQGASARLVPRLKRAEETMVELREQVRALDPPREAERLHAALLRLLDADVSLAREVAAIGAYQVELAKRYAPLARASNRLATRLRSAGAPADQQQALADHARAVDGVSSSLSRLDAPRALAAAHVSLLARLRHISAATRALRGAIERRDDAAIARELDRLRIASAPSAAAQAAARRGIEEYNRRVGTVGQRARAVERERARLAEVLD